MTIIILIIIITIIIIIIIITLIYNHKSFGQTVQPYIQAQHWIVQQIEEESLLPCKGENESAIKRDCKLVMYRLYLFEEVSLCSFFNQRL